MEATFRGRLTVTVTAQLLPLARTVIKALPITAVPRHRKAHNPTSPWFFRASALMPGLCTMRTRETPGPLQPAYLPVRTVNQTVRISQSKPRATTMIAQGKAAPQTVLPRSGGAHWASHITADPMPRNS